MASSTVQICNLALSEIGESTITSLTENSKAARECNLIFDQCLDYLLQIYPWNFAQERKRLAVLSDDPLFEYEYAFQLPTDPYCLQVNEMYGDYEYVVEGRKLLTDQSICRIRYTKRIEDMTELSAVFVEVLTFYLATKLAKKLSSDESLSNNMYSRYERALKFAKMKDAQENSVKEVPDGTWVKER